MAGSAKPGPQCAHNQDWCIEDGTLILTECPTPGSVCSFKLKSQDKDITSPTLLKKPYVIFFGGFLASWDDMDKWLRSARSQRPDVAFDAYPYMGGDSGRASTIDSFNPMYDSVIRSIKLIKESGAPQIFIVGHSSGSAIAEELDHRLKDLERTRLVVLDGFPPLYSKQLVRTEAWSAKSGDNPSRNYVDLHNWFGDALKCHKAKKDCTNSWALHFSLVNLAANDRDIEDGHHIGNGYKDCIANLDWLEGACHHKEK